MSHELWLRQAYEALVARGDHTLANTCSQASVAYAALEAEVERLNKSLDVAGACATDKNRQFAEMKQRIDHLESWKESVSDDIRALRHFRVGELPAQGWLRDNDSSRLALDSLIKRIDHGVPPAPLGSEQSRRGTFGITNRFRLLESTRTRDLHILDDRFDLKIRVEDDFEDDELRQDYFDELVGLLNSAEYTSSQTEGSQS